VESGLVERTVGSDRRRRVLRLTSLGTRKHGEAYPFWEEVQRMVADELGDADVADLLAGLRRLRQSSDRARRTRTRPLRSSARTNRESST
jgi:DNA-binding MarR family transcriptional regulator